MFKHYIKISAFIFLVVFIFQSCKQQKKELRVGILMPHYTTERWEKDRDYLVREVKKMDGMPFVKVANKDAELQAKQARELIDKKDVDFLVIVSVDRNKAAEIVQYAHKNDVKVIAYDRLVKGCDLDFYVSFDSFLVGRLQAKYLSDHCKGNNYALINGPTSDNNSYLLKLGQLSVLQPLTEQNKATIVYNVFANSWSKSQGYKHMDTCYQKHKDLVDAVIAGNDEIARGAIQYYLANDTLFNHKICFAGQDADLDNCRLISQNIQTMTVYKPLDELAKTTANVIHKLHNKKEFAEDSITSINNNHTMVPAILHDVYAVDKDNLDEMIIQNGHHCKNDIYKDTVN